MRHGWASYFADVIGWISAGFFCGVGVVFMLSVLVSIDDTQPPTSGAGIAVIIDHSTGCQYLRSMFGHMTPRMSASGQMGCKQ